MGNLKGIRENNGKNHKANSTIHNFWSFGYIVQRFKEKAEEYGIQVVEVSEHKTSTKCLCGSENTIKTGRLLKCLNCGIEAHRDAVGVLNIGYRQGGSINGVMAYPLPLRWNGMRWEPRRAVNNRPMNTLEAGISPSSAGRVSMMSKSTFLSSPIL